MGSHTGSDSDIEMMDIDNEIIELHQESQAVCQNPFSQSMFTSSHSGEPNWLFDITLGGKLDDEEYDPGDDEVAEGDNIDNVLDMKSNPYFKDTFIPYQLGMIWECIETATIPSWVEHPPSNLGEKTH